MIEKTSEIEWVNSFEPGMWTSSNGQQKPIKDLPVPYMANCVNKLKKLKQKLLASAEMWFDKDTAVDLIEIKIKEFSNYAVILDLGELTEDQVEKFKQAFGQAPKSYKLKVVQDV